MIQVWRQDNAGENKVLEKNTNGEHWKIKTKFKYTASSTPQPNLYAEMGYTALAGMMRAVMSKGNIRRAIRYNLFGKVVKTATKLDSLVLVDINWGQENTCQALCQFNTQLS